MTDRDMRALHPFQRGQAIQETKKWVLATALQTIATLVICSKFLCYRSSDEIAKGNLQTLWK